MSRTIEVDEELVGEALAATGACSERDAVEEALKMLIRVKAQGSMRDLFGKVEWEGDLEQSRLGRFNDL